MLLSKIYIIDGYNSRFKVKIDKDG